MCGSLTTAQKYILGECVLLNKESTEIALDSFDKFLYL